MKSLLSESLRCEESESTSPSLSCIESEIIKTHFIILIVTYFIVFTFLCQEPEFHIIIHRTLLHYRWHFLHHCVLHVIMPSLGKDNRMILVHLLHYHHYSRFLPYNHLNNLQCIENVLIKGDTSVMKHTYTSITRNC